MRRGTRSLTFVVLLGLLALAPARAATQSSTRVDTIVRVAQAPVHPGVATLVEEISIGVADGAEEYMLGDVADIVIGRDGTMYVLDRQVPAIRQYDDRGKYIRTIGRGGAGPGEYRSPSGLATMRDGRLLLWDTGNWRINVYSADGTTLTQWQTPSGSSGSSSAQFSRALLVDTAGIVITRKTIFSRDFNNRPTVWVRFRSDGSLIDTIQPLPVPREVPGLSVARGNASMSIPLPFSPRRVVVMSPLGYLVAGFPDRYAFELHQPGGPIVSVRRDMKPEPVSRAEGTEARRGIEARMREMDPNWSWNGPDIPDTKPLYSDLLVGLDGRIWIALAPEVGPRIGNTSSSMGVGNPGGARRPPPSKEREPSKPALYDVFEPDGRYLGQVQVPARVSSVVRRGDQVWAVAFDAEDVPRIKRYRITWR